MITIKIRTHNAAFDGGAGRRLEVARILRDLADKIESGRGGEIPLMDLNGNRVGNALGI